MLQWAFHRSIFLYTCHSSLSALLPSFCAIDPPTSCQIKSQANYKYTHLGKDQLSEKPPLLSILDVSLLPLLLQTPRVTCLLWMFPTPWWIQRKNCSRLSNWLRDRKPVRPSNKRRGWRSLWNLLLSTSWQSSRPSSKISPFTHEWGITL